MANKTDDINAVEASDVKSEIQEEEKAEFNEELSEQKKIDEEEAENTPDASPEENAEPDPFEQAELEELAAKDASADDSGDEPEPEKPADEALTKEEAAVTDKKSYEKMLKKQEKQAVKAAKKNLKEEEEAKKKAEREKEEEEKKKEKTPPVTPLPTPPANQAHASAPNGGTMAAPKPAPRGTYARVMTTGQYIGAFVLMLIPGLNILCVLVWALGGAKNPNKVNFVRGCIVFFLIEVVLCALIFGGTYIYMNQHQTKYLNRLNSYTNGLLDYFNIDSYKELPKLRNTSKYLIPKNSPIPEGKKVRATRVVENPSEIKTYQDFQAMYKSYKPGSVTRASLGKHSQTDDKGYYTGEQFSGTARNLVDFMKKYHVDSSSAGLVYIIIDNNGNNNCIIAFDPTGTIQKVPTIRVNNKTIFVGGVN